MQTENKEYNTATQSPASSTEDTYVLIIEEESNEIVDIYISSQEKEDMKTDEFSLNSVSRDKQNPSSDDNDIIYKKQKPLQSITPHLKCDSCPFTSHKRYLLLRHMKTHSKESSFYKCSICERGFKTLVALQNHENTHSGARPYACKHCEKCFNTSGEVVRHVRYKHSLEKPYACAQCEYCCVERPKMRRHLRIHTGERPYQCPHCTYASADTFKLKRHLRTHSNEKPYQCDLCKRRFTQSNSLKAHKLIHNVSERLVFQCELCPVKCHRQTDLRTHKQKLHSNDSIYNCTYCNKTFRDKYSYNVHIKTHKGEKKYKCEKCSYRSDKRDVFNSHVFTHTGEKPFTCDHCQQSFRQKQLLRRHINTWHNPNYVPAAATAKTHACPHCRKTFARKGNLIRHMSLHAPKIQQPKLYVMNEDSFEVKEKELDKQEFIKRSEEPPVNLLKQDEIITVEDGKHFVVLQVVHMDDEITEIENTATSGQEEKECSQKLNNDTDTFFGFEEDNKYDELTACISRY